MLVINLMGGPGAGKSTTAAGTFFELKNLGINCELITEYAKSKVWEESFKTLDDQLYIFGKQHHRQFVCKDKVDVIITDSPLLLSLIYGDHLPKCFKELVMATYNNFDNVNFYINRVKEYNPAGRMQTLDGAKEIDNTTMNMLKKYEIPFHMVDGNRNAPIAIVDVIKPYLKLAGKD